MRKFLVALFFIVTIPLACYVASWKFDKQVPRVTEPTVVYGTSPVRFFSSEPAKKRTFHLIKDVNSYCNGKVQSGELVIEIKGTRMAVDDSTIKIYDGENLVFAAQTKDRIGLDVENSK